MVMMTRVRRMALGALAALVVAGALPAAAAAGAAAGGADQYRLACHGVYCKITGSALAEIEAMRSKVESGEICAGLGSSADEICNRALERFSSEAPDAGDDDEKEAVFDEKVEELERALDTPLQLVYLRQLGLIRERALQRYRSASKSSETSDYQAMVAADQYFAREAEASTRQGSSWDYAVERAGLQSTMNELAQRSKKATDAALRAAQQQSTAMSFLQVQQQQLAALQQQLYGGNAPFNCGVAYRFPDTNINISGNYQQGKTNIQISCIPDDYAPLLGSNGFTHGVGPGNLGVSVNLNF